MIIAVGEKCFNGHPPWGVNATSSGRRRTFLARRWFQWAPTLGGECYQVVQRDFGRRGFLRFNGHPPLGVNATV